MRSEINKLYENAEVKKQIPKICSNNELYCKDCKAHIKNAMPYCENAEYPPFTAEKQIELIKWLAKRDYGDYTSSLLINITADRVYFSAAAKPKNYVIEVLYDSNRCTDFDNALANLINNLWQDLTEEERKQIKEILE